MKKSTMQKKINKGVEQKKISLTEKAVWAQRLAGYKASDAVDNDDVETLLWMLR